MAKRKTVEIETIIERANTVFRASDDSWSDQRTAIQMFVADVLMEAGQYKGFRYLTKGETDGKTFGVTYDGVNQPTFHDQSRISFY